MQRAMRAGLAAVMAVVVATAGMAQEPVKPGPEHEKLKDMVGVWDAVMKVGGQESKGVMTYTLGLNGLFLFGEFKGDFGGMAFEGRSFVTYDPNKKKYLGTWIDNMAPAIMNTEGTYDATGKVFNETMEGTGMDGKPAKFKSTTTMVDKDTMTFKMAMCSPDGTEQPMMEITYKRKR